MGHEAEQRHELAVIFVNAHELVLDSHERLEAWTSYDRVIRLAMGFIRNCPEDPANGLPWYLQYSCFWTDPLRPTIWPDNPAGKFAWAVTTLLRYYPYSGDRAHVEIVRSMLDRLWDYRTPPGSAWPDVPYASAHPGTGVYFGARADGVYVTEPDKVAQVGRAYVDFYEITGEARYLEIGKRCADVLVGRIRDGDETMSPWPFRVDIRDGSVVEEYTSHMIPAVRLLEELNRLGVGDYQAARDRVWAWIVAYPLVNNRWKGHFEDIRLDPENENRDQVSALETARYILQNKHVVPDWQASVKGLIDWVRDTLGAPPFFTAVSIHEQKYCWYPMGSHTARFAALAALYAHETGDATYREQAIRSFNWASYMANDDGTVTVGIDRPDYYNQCWFTDGYFDYVPHFIDGLGAMPELAPADTDRMIRSTSVVQEIEYAARRLTYRLFEPGTQLLRLTFEPREVLADGISLSRLEAFGDTPGWTWDPGLRLATIRAGARDVLVTGW